MAETHLQICVAAFYKFARLDDCEAICLDLTHLCGAEGVNGTLLIDGEGINGTIAGSGHAIECVLAYCRRLPGCADLEVKILARGDGDISSHEGAGETPDRDDGRAAD